MKIKLWLNILVAASVCITACRKNPGDSLSDDERRIYITNHNSSISFSQYKTFSVAESVLLVDGNNAQQQLTASDQAFISAFKSAMQARGFILVDVSADPDLGVQISRIIQTSTGFVSVPDYWGYWDPGFWGGGFGPGYGWGTPFWRTQAYQVREGMLAFDVIDLKNAATTNNLQVIWNGLIRGSGINSAATAGAQVEQLFSQSPYLKTN